MKGEVMRKVFGFFKELFEVLRDWNAAVTLELEGEDA